MAKKFVGFVIVVLFAVISGIALFNKGLPPTHDGEYHVMRFYEFDKVVRSGDLYPRWAPDFNNGFGIPLFNYVYPLPNYVSFIFHSFGISFIDSFKLNMFAAGLVGAIFFYLWARIWWGNIGGVVSSVFYTYAPYRFVDIYVRGSVGEVWALAFFPAFLWSITKFIDERRIRYFSLSSVFLALIIFSHNILALMFFAFALSYIVILICKSNNKRFLILNTSYIILLGIGLSSIFWLPAIAEKNFTVGLQVFGIENHFPDLYQLIIPSWGTGFSGSAVQNQMSFQLGLANLLGVFISFIVFIFLWVKKNKKFSIIVFFLVWFFLLILLMNKMSQPVWEKTPFMNYFQFPWRFLSLSILTGAFLSGSVFIILGGKKAIFLSIFMIVGAFLLGIGYAKPAYYLERDDNYYTSRSDFIDGTNSPGNAFNTLWFNSSLGKQKEKLEFVEGNGKIETEFIKPTHYRFIVEANKKSQIQVNTAYFPGWEISIDGRKTEVYKAEEGLFTFYTPQGSHLVEVKLRDTHIRKVALLISLGSFILLPTSLWFGRMKKRA